MNANQASRNNQRPQTIPRRRVFTLVEMMVVVVIVVIVMGVSIPAFMKLTSGSSVRGGVRLLAAQVRLTRQFAISQRRTVALLMPGEIIEGGANKLPDDLSYVAMKPAIVEDNSGNYEFVAWVDGSKWLHVPRGAVIAEVDGDQGVAAKGSSYNVTAPAEDGKCLVTVPFVQLGDLYEPLESLSGNATIRRAIVFSPTGRVKGPTEANLTVAQLIYTKGGWISKTSGTSGTSTQFTANQFNINVNTFTGRIKVESPPEY